MAFGLGGCATANAPAPDAVLTENQVINMIEHPTRWYGRVVTVKIFPFDNGYPQSFVACFEQCDPVNAAEGAVLIYTKSDRFKGYHGDRPVIVKATFRRLCPDSMPVCLDGRVFALDELN